MLAIVDYIMPNDRQLLLEMCVRPGLVCYVVQLSAGGIIGLTYCTGCLLVACICLGCGCRFLHGHLLGVSVVILGYLLFAFLSLAYAFQSMAAEPREALASS